MTKAATIERIPQHIAVVMDGNGRWAQKRHLPRLAGHKQGLESLRTCIASCHALGVKALTVFAFSSENWNRPAEEVSGIIELMMLALGREAASLKKKGVRMHFIGERKGLSERLCRSFDKATSETAGGDKMDFNICFNYGGRWDMAQAAAKVAASGAELSPENIDRALALAHVSDPDLLIRTGGEQRISNFLLWQAAYSELYFSDKLWPEFDEAALLEAIADFNRRERRFGKTSAQDKTT